MFTATGSPAICVGYVSIFTPSAVTFPPSPPGPMLSLFISFADYLPDSKVSNTKVYVKGNNILMAEKVFGTYQNYEIIMY